MPVLILMLTHTHIDTRAHTHNAVIWPSCHPLDNLNVYSHFVFNVNLYFIEALTVNKSKSTAGAVQVQVNLQEQLTCMLGHRVQD